LSGLIVPYFLKLLLTLVSWLFSINSYQIIVILGFEGEISYITQDNQYHLCYSSILFPLNEEVISKALPSPSAPEEDNDDVDLDPE
jgi:hypothetical protein